MYFRLSSLRGFTLIELLVVIAIVGILAVVVYANFSTSNAKGRDAKRQADLRLLQNAIEQYKTKYGRYPAQGAGCTTLLTGPFAIEKECPTSYIVGHASGINFVPDFLPRLPRDPKRGTKAGFAYLTNAEGTVYKAMVMNTVEETVTYAHPFRSCDVKSEGISSRNINVSGWCTRVNSFGLFAAMPDQCKDSDSRFKNSYGVWGGIADIIAVGTKGKELDGGCLDIPSPGCPTGRTSNNDIARVLKTTDIICR